jgi:hypothetical protein
MSMVMRRWSVVPVFAIVALAIVGCAPGSTGPNSPPAPSTVSPDQATPADKRAPLVADPKAGPAENTPDAKLTVEEFYKESQKDPNYLINKHAGKLVELTGGVRAAMLDFGGDPVLLLNVGGSEFDRVNCPVGDRNHWSKAFPGQTVTLRGRVPSSVNDPKLFVWEIKSVTGPQPTRLSVEDFVKEVVADPEAAEKKYKGKRVILTGEVAEPKTHEGKLVGVRLSLKEKEPAVVCYAVGAGGSKEEDFVKGVAKPGQKVTVLVELDAYSAGEISLRGPIIDPPY